MSFGKYLVGEKSGEGAFSFPIVVYFFRLSQTYGCPSINISSSIPLAIGD